MKWIDFIRKLSVVITLFIYSFLMLFGYFPFLNFVDNVYAENKIYKTNLVLLLVDSNVYNRYPSDIKWYSSYIQQINKNTKVLTFPINTTLVKAQDIVKVINNLYFNGEKNKTSFLKSVVLIGNVPLPVVNKDGFIFPSVYPYVDIVDPSFKYDGKYFTFTGKPSDVELTHGIIRFNSISDYGKYFQKLREYISNPSGFVDKAFYYDDFINLQKSLSSDTLKLYLNKLIFASNLVNGKISPLLLDLFDEKNKQAVENLLKDSTDSLSSTSIKSDNSVVGSLLGFNSADVTNFNTFVSDYNNKLSNYINKYSNILEKIKDEKNTYWQIPTKSLETSLKGFFRNFSDIFGNEYLSNISDNIIATARYDWTNTNTTLNLVDLKDLISINYLKDINTKLVDLVDNNVETNKYYMYYPIMIKYVNGANNGYDLGFVGTPTCEKTYETFFFGKNVNDISSIKDLTIFRGTFQNYTGIDILKTLPTKKLKSVISNWNIFSIQVDSNRAYDTSNMISKDANNFKNVCSKVGGACTNLGKTYYTEGISSWAKRIYGGYSPLNIKISSASNVNYKFDLNYSNFKYAWHPIETPNKNGSLFNLAGSVYVNNKFETDDIFKLISNYSAVWKTSWYSFPTYVSSSCSVYHNAGGLSKERGTYYDYFKNFSQISATARCPLSTKPADFALNGNILTVKKYTTYSYSCGGGSDDDDRICCGFIKDRVVKYKFIDTRYKHIDPTSDTLDKLSVSTWARPVDENNYISFLGVGGDTIKLYYPDIFSVDVYIKNGDKLILKTPDEIANSIKTYLKNVVINYNKKLKEQLDKKGTFYNTYKNAWNKISNNLYKPHNYSLLPEDFLINNLGDKKIAQIAEMLYYLNLGWKERVDSSNLKEELDSLYSGFNLSEKIDYLVKNFLDTEDANIVNGLDISHSDLNFPGKPKNGYEAGIIYSANLDDAGDILLKNDQGNILANQLLQKNTIDSLSIIEGNKKECGRQLGEAVILWDWPSAFICRLSETLKKPFKIGSSSSCSANNQTFDNFLKELKDLKVSPEKDLGINLPVNTSLQEYLASYPSKAIEYKKWLDLKKAVSSYYSVSTDKGVYDYNDLTGDIFIKPLLSSIVGKISYIELYSPNITGNCIYANISGDYKNLCNGLKLDNFDTWKIPFAFYNLKTKEGRYYAYKAGKKYINIKFCDINNICYTKQIYFIKKAGDVKYVKILPFSKIMVNGGINPIVIKGYDSLPTDQVYQNQVDSTYYDYVIKLDPPIGKFKVNGLGQDEISFNFKDEPFILQLNKQVNNINKIKIIGRLSDNWLDVLSGVVLTGFDTIIDVYNKDNLSADEVKIFPSINNIQLPDPSSLYSGNILDKNKIWKIKIKPLVNGQTLKTSVFIKDETGHFIIGTYQDGKFVAQNDFLISSNDGLVVYAVPTYKTGPFKIKIQIPGINSYYLNGNINAFPVKALYVKLDKYQAKPNELIQGKIFGVDNFGNLISNLNGLNITKSEGIDLVRNGNDLKIKGTKTGWIKFSYKNKDGKIISNTVYIGINSTFLPLNKKISVMYLTLFGYDWGKYAPSIMSNSDKNLAITTLNVDSNNLKKFDIIVDSNLSSNVQSDLLYSGGNVVLDFSNIKLYTNQNPLKDIQYSKTIDSIINNGVYYIPEGLDDVIFSNFISDGKLQINNTVVADFKNGILLSPNLKISLNIPASNNYGKGVYDVFFSDRLVGKIVINEKLNISNFKLDKPFYTKIIYGGASTNGIKSFGISISDQSYKSISKTTFLDFANDKKIGFRSNFKNITNFAAGLDVGDATKPFQNEFLINYGDPFVKKISDNTIVPQISMSKTYGYNVYHDISGGIKKVISLDFNNDGKKDLLILYEDGRIRLLKNYVGNKNFEDLGNLMVIAKPIKDIFPGDYNGDGYEDLYITFIDGSVRVYKNNHGEFSVNGFPVCLDLAKSDPYHLKYSQIFFLDMNNNKKTDVVVNDLVGNIKIFYDGTYLSNILTGCDINFKARLKQQLVKSYAIKVDKTQKFTDAGYIYRDGLTQTGSTLLKEEFQKAMDNGDISGLPSDPNITPSNYIEKVQSAGQDKFAFQPIPKSLGPSYVNFNEDTVNFKKITFLTNADDINVYKTMEDLNGGYLENGDKVRITVYFDNPTGKKFTYLEELKGPYGVVSLNNKPILELNGIDKDQITYPYEYDNILFRIDGVNKTSSVTYYAIYKGTSSVKIKVGDWDKNKLGEIKVFLNNGCIKGYDYFQGTSSGTPMNFIYSFENLKNLLEDKINNLDSTKNLDNFVSALTTSRTDVGLATDIFNSYFGNSVKEDNPWYNFNMDFSASIGPDINKIKSKIGDKLKGLCNGFSIGKSDCGGINVPCNFAFFAPGIINACGCPLGIDPGYPVFWYPGTVYTTFGPIPVPWGLMSSSDNIPNGGAFPSVVRLYVSPTLTAGLGVAVCFDNYKAAMLAPTPPLGAIAGNCIVAAKSLSSNNCSKTDNQNADDELDDWMLDLDNGVCNQLTFKHGIYPISPLTLPSSTNFYGASINPAFSNYSAGGIINFDATAHKINSLQDAEVLMKGGKPLNLKIETGTAGGLIKCIIKKWLNKQIEFLISNLTSMTIYVVYPNVDDLLSNFKDTWDGFNKSNGSMKGSKEKDYKEIINDLKSSFDDSLSSIKDSYNSIGTGLKKYFPSKNLLKETSDQLSNPFKKLKLFFEKIPLVNVSEKVVVLNVPWIGKDEVERQILYLQNWYARNKSTISKWNEFVASGIGKCDELYKDNVTKQNECKQLYAKALKLKKFVDSVQKNIEILEKYRNLPLQLYQYVHLVDFYMSQITCILNKYVDMIVGWLHRNSLIFEKWVDAIITIINTIKTWQILIDISVNWKTTCGKCRADNGDLYDCVLSGLCPDLPVLPIPPFKIPDIFIDLSHINLGLTIVLPRIKINPVPVGLFTLPDLPNLTLNIEIPSVPLLPEPPEFPPLPSLPAVPTLELPNLPPPPMIPKLMPSIKGSLEVFKIVGYFRCIIKNGIGLVAEWNVKTRIEQLTARTNRLFPFDFLTIDFPVLPWKGFDVKIDSYVNYNLNFDQVYTTIKNILEPINKITSNLTDEVLEFNQKWNQKTSEFQFDNFNIDIKPGAYKLPSDIKKDTAYYGISPKYVKAFLYNELEYLLSQKNKDYMKSIPEYVYDNTNKLLKDILKPSKITANYGGVNSLKGEIKKLISSERAKLIQLEKQIKAIGSGNISNFSLATFSNNYGKNYKFETSLFLADKSVLNKLDVNPKKEYISMYGKILNRFAKSLVKYETKKDDKYYLYKNDEHLIKKSFKLINNAIGTNYKLPLATSVSNTIEVDPTQFINGLYLEGTDGTYYNILADKDKAKRIRENDTYGIYDVNNDHKDDVIWWDGYNVYIKYSGDKPQNDGIINTNFYVYNGIVTNFSTIVDSDGYVTLNGEKFKIWDVFNPVNDLKFKGSSYENISLIWGNNTKTNAYVILYSSRPDILDDIEKNFNYSYDFDWAGKNYLIYGIVLYDSKLGNINDYSASDILVDGHYAKNFKYIAYDNLENIDDVLLVLNKDDLFLNNKWKYFRVFNADLNLKDKQLKILSTYSNQDVGGEQIIGDDEMPDVEIKLIRDKQGDVIQTGTNLVGYVNTSYTLKADWKDNVAMKEMFILDTGFNIISTGDTIKLNEVSPTVKKYHFVGIDWDGNKQDILVTLTIKVPKIDIVKVDADNGVVVTKIEKDMDLSAVEFFVKKDGKLVALKSLNGKELFTGGYLNIIFTGGIFNPNKSLTLYNSDGDEIGKLNMETGIINVDAPYKVYGVSDNGILYTEIFEPKVNSGSINYVSLFKIYIPSSGLAIPPEMLNTSKYNLKDLSGVNLGIFSNSYCIFDKKSNSCAVYISKNKGDIYIDPNYKFIAKYSYNSLGIVTYTFYDIPVVFDPLFTKENEIFTVSIKPANILKLTK